ncbi:zinc finger protein 138-like [Planococcus citri]|uniref:zinc finger protein 138-like n=1 Tax=Planococcus citri TaxID=170843 RepID=UPI0031F7AFB6
MNHLQYNDITSQVGLHENHFNPQAESFSSRLHLQTHNIVDKLGHASILPHQVINDTSRYHLNTTLQNFDSMMRHNSIYINAKAESSTGESSFKEQGRGSLSAEKKNSHISYNNQLLDTTTKLLHKNLSKQDNEYLKFSTSIYSSIADKSSTTSSNISTCASLYKSKFMVVDVGTMTDPLTLEEQERLSQWEGFAALQSGNKVAEYLTSLREFLKIAPPTEGRKRQGLGDVRIVTAPDGSRFFCCSECHMAYPDKFVLEQHLANHRVQRRFICIVCGAGLKRKEHLDRHQLSHSEERPYTCDTCSKTFKRTEHLARHYIVHSGEKGHVCSECGKAFYRRDHLQKHTQGHITKRLRLAIQSTTSSSKAIL